MSVCLYVCLYVCLSVCLSVCLYVCMLCVCRPVCLYVCLPAYQDNRGHQQTNLPHIDALKTEITIRFAIHGNCWRKEKANRHCTMETQSLATNTFCCNAIVSKTDKRTYYTARNNHQIAPDTKGIQNYVVVKQTRLQLSTTSVSGK